ncbi:pentatricopeptide repeat protein [Artemisia annua]|uniref:Pentatricopeptide repeat protein n=1 Tax=Artemisia annua TaxID=35608 RepID=A0A2U1MN85_ARTAN|nr:pentatricopeptide repeat protein [Artemisia annua]
MVFQKGISPDVITYSSLIDGLCNLGRWEEASKMLQEMLDVGISLDVQTFSILVDALCKEGKVEAAENVIDIMLERVTYNTMIQGLFPVGRCSDARKLFDEMLAKCQLPNECTYQILIEGLCYNHQVEEALSMFQSSGDSKLKSNIIVYSILIDGARKCGKLDIAQALFHELTLKEMLLHEMDGRQFTLDVSTLSLLLDRIASVQDSQQPASLNTPDMLPSVSGSSVVAFPMIQASAASIPVQVTTVDGLVSTFTVSNVFESALDDSRSSAAYQVRPISERRFHVGEGSSNIPMILDFSATGSSQISTAARRGGRPRIANLSNGRRSTRGGTARVVGNRSHARAASASTMSSPFLNCTKKRTTDTCSLQSSNS